MQSIKIALISSCGGHLTEIRTLKPIYSKYNHFYILNDNAILPDDMKSNTYFITHSERDWKFFINLWEAIRLLLKEKPNLIISTGAGLIVPFTLIARLFGIKVAYIETYASVIHPTLTGKIMYYLANHFYYQWPNLRLFFPKGDYIGSLL